MEQIIKNWLENAKWAPSGGNIQPWMVEVMLDGEQISLKLRIRDEIQTSNSAADQWGAGALIGLGCYAENLVFLAPSIGYQLIKRNFVSAPSHFTSYEQLLFTPSGPEPKGSDFAEKSAFVKRRTTNRWPFSQNSILKPLLNQWIEHFEKDIELSVVTDKRQKIINIYRELAFLRMHNDALFNELMHEIYDSNSDQTRQTGLPFLTLALPTSTVFILKWIQKLGLHPKSRLANKQSVKDSIDQPLTHCGDLLYLSAKDDSPNGWNQVGHAYQKLNLLLEKEGLAQQPIAYNLMAYNHLYNPKQSLLNTIEAQRMSDLSIESKKELGFDFAKPGLLVRIGTPLHKAQPSPRRSVEYSIRVENMQERFKQTP